MLQKAGNLAEAVTIWEKAVDRYAEGGFFNPAIALCNKILRQSPGRTVVYYKLGKIHAEKGFKGDARQNFLEYASRQQKSGNLDEAFRALKEFADLVPDQHDVRLMLADQLVKADRKDEAVSQLQLGYSQATAEGDHKAADDLAAKMKEIDPSVEPEASEGPSVGGGGGLVFLDTGDADAKRRPSRPVSQADLKRVTKAVEGLQLLEPPPDLPATPAAKPASKPTPAKPAEPPAPAAAAAELLIEPTDVGADAPPPPRGSVIGLEITNLSEETPAPVADLPLMDIEPPAAAPVADLPLIEAAPLIEPEPTISLDPLEEPVTSGNAVPDLDLLDVEHSGAVDAPTFDAPAAAPADLPLMDLGDDGLDLIEPITAPSRPSAPAAGLPMLDDEAEAPSAREVAVPVSAPLSVDSLRAKVEAAPEDWGAHRQLAEALLEAGDRAGAMVEFETAMAGFETEGDLDTAGSIAEEIVRLDPKSIRSHQKRVEFAFRANDRASLAEAYLELADALLGDGQAQKARTVYQRVLDIRPDDLRAQAAIESIPLEEEPPPPPPRRSTTAAPVKAAAPVAAPKPAADDDYVSLGDWLREDDEPKSTRMVVEEKEPTGDEAADFSDMLRKFKQGVADNVDDEDHEAHYDLGVAYKEMGLVDEAIAEFQKALRGTANRARTFEALGNCFVEKGQHRWPRPSCSARSPSRACATKQLVGVLYLLGAIAEEQQQFPDAKRYYERVFAVDIQFRDIGDRLNTRRAATDA
jgi:tetratricopeptide (TPR) repeat protein